MRFVPRHVLYCCIPMVGYWNLKAEMGQAIGELMGGMLRQRLSRNRIRIRNNNRRQRMPELMKREIYPKGMSLEIERMGRIAVNIANRWVLGWPGRVKKLISQGVYLQTLREQRELELDAIAENLDTHLTETEKAQLAGLSLECPIAED